jgi:hypothetical protein
MAMMDSQPDMFATEEVSAVDDRETSEGIGSSAGFDRQDSDCSWAPGSTPASSQPPHSINNDKLFLVSLAAIQSLFA